MKKAARKVGTIPPVSCPSCRKGQVFLKKLGGMLFGSCEKCGRTYAQSVKKAA